MFLTDEYVWRKEVDPGIELSSLNRRDSGNESEVVVEGDDWLEFPQSLSMYGLGKGGWILSKLLHFVRKVFFACARFMLLGNENVINFTTKSIA